MWILKGGTIFSRAECVLEKGPHLSLPLVSLGPIMQTFLTWGVASRVCKWPNDHHVIFEGFLYKVLLRVEPTCLSFLGALRRGIIGRR